MSAEDLGQADRATGDWLAADGPLSEEAARLALAAPDAGVPASGVKERLMARVRAAGASGAAANPASDAWRFASLDAAEGWLRLPFPGVRLRELAVDRARDSTLLYIEMAPGALFPDHVHTAPERGIVLTGDFQMGDRLLRAGEFYEAAAGTRHKRLSSPSGCTGLLWVGAVAWDAWRAALAK